MSPQPKRHLARQASGQVRVAACGLRNPPAWTRDPAQVTCLGCQRTVYMADAEIEATRRRNNR